MLHRSLKYRWMRKPIASILVLAICTTSIPISHAKNFATRDELENYTREQTSTASYADVMEVGQACAESFTGKKEETYVGLTGQMFLMPEETAFNLSAEQRKKTLIEEIQSTETHPYLLGQLERESTQIYLNQLLYNWKLQSKIFRGTETIDLGQIGSWEEIEEAVKTGSSVIQATKNIPNAIDPIELQNHVKAFNSIIKNMNDMCDDSHLLYTQLMYAYEHSEAQDPATNEYLQVILGDKDNYAFVDGGIKGAIRKKIQEVKNIATLEASLYKAILSQTMFGKMYAIGTQLQKTVGEYDTLTCVERGKKLNPLPTDHHNLWIILGNSYGYLDWKYKKSVHDTLDSYGENDAEDVLEEYAQTNPATLQQLLISNPSKQKAIAVCQLIQGIRNENGIKNTIGAILAPVTILASMMTAGAASYATASWIAYASLVLNGYFFGSTVMDLSLSYDLEQRLNASILADQIDANVGQDMIRQIQSSRPFSYINLALSGLGSAAATARMSQLNKMKVYREYIATKGGSTPQKFAATQKTFLASQIKFNPLTRLKVADMANQIRAIKNPGNKILSWITGKKPATEPQGVPHNVANIQNYLNFAKNEKAAGNGGKFGYGDDLYYKIPDPKTPPRGPITSKDPVTGRTPINIRTSTTKPQASVEVAVKTKPLSPMNRFEVEPDVVPMPVEPTIVPMPVLPDWIESPIAMTKEKYRELLENQKQFQKKQRALLVIENDLSEADMDIIALIELYANEQSDLGKKARDWLTKRGNQFRTSYVDMDIPQNSKEVSLIGEITTVEERAMALEFLNNGLGWNEYMRLPRANSSTEMTKIYTSKTGTYFLKFNTNNFIENIFNNQKQISSKEYAAYLINRRLINRYPASILIEINGKPVFISKSAGSIDMEYIDHNQHSHQIHSMDELTATVFDNDAKLLSSDLKSKARLRGFIDYNMPDDIVLFDFLIGNTDRSLMYNVFVPNQAGKTAYTYHDLPIHYPMNDEDVKIFDGERSFKFLISSTMLPRTRFESFVDDVLFPRNIVQKYYYEDIPNLDRRTWFKELVHRNEKFVNRLREWQPWSIEYLLTGYLTKDQIDLVLQNREWILAIADAGADPIEIQHDKEALKRQLTLDFNEINKHYASMMQDLDDRDSFLEYMVEDEVFSQEYLDLLPLKDLNFKFTENTDNQWVIAFNKATEVIMYENAQVVDDLKKIMRKYGFDTINTETTRGTYGLKIIPTPKTKFYGTLTKYTKGMTVDPIKFFNFIFNPVELHIISAMASVYEARVEFGMDTVQNMILNELSTTDYHEIRHLMFHIMRINKVPSIYHQYYNFDHGVLNKTNGYKHYVSAEEIFAFSNNIKEEVANVRNVAFPDRKNPSETIVPERPDLLQLRSQISTLYEIQKGILKSSYEFLTAINERSFEVPLITEGGPPPSIQIKLKSGQTLNKYFVSPDERKVFNSYLTNKSENQAQILSWIYDDQLQLNHLAYRQIINLQTASKNLKEYELKAAQDELSKSILSNDEIEARNRLLNLGLNGALRVYQLSKKSNEFHRNDIKQYDNEEWKYVVNLPFTKVEPVPVYGDTNFLNQMHYHVEDINESRQNPITLFRGISTFFDEQTTSQKDLEIFTKWLVNHFSFAPFWGKNQHGNDWGQSYLQMWPKAKFTNQSTSLQFDLIFLVDEKNRPFVLVKIPRLKKEMLYHFEDLALHLDRYISDTDLKAGIPWPESKYYYLDTNAQKDVKKKTSWSKELYEDIPPRPISHQWIN